jgi:hypothetical protein
MTKKNFAPRFINDTQVAVTKQFAKNARIFGTAEYKVWKEIKADCPTAEMVTKNIKKNPNKKNDTKNMTYERMAIFIREQDNAAALMVEFKKHIALSQVQTNPYRSVLAWFKKTFTDYDEYKEFFEAEAKKEAKKKDIFALVESSVVITTEDSEEEEYDNVSGL